MGSPLWCWSQLTHLISSQVQMMDILLWQGAMGTFRESFDSAQIKRGWILNIMIHDFQQESLLPGVRFQLLAKPWFFQGHRSIPAARCVSNKSCNTHGSLVAAFPCQVSCNQHPSWCTQQFGSIQRSSCPLCTVPCWIGNCIVKGNPSNFVMVC